MVIVIKRLAKETFELVTNNSILFTPLLVFILLTGFVMASVSVFQPVAFVVFVALISVFFSGWFSMFHKCIENAYNKDLTDEEKQLNSLNLYKEFFPGVGKNFIKIALGMLLYIILLNIVMFVGESIAKFIVGPFENFSAVDVSHFKTKQDISVFLSEITPADKMKLIKIGFFELIFSGIFAYFSMFWVQALVTQDKTPLKSYLESINTVLQDSLNTSLMFVLGIVSFILLFIFNIAFGMNPFAQFLLLFLFVYAAVYYIMMAFLYFEKYR